MPNKILHFKTDDAYSGLASVEGIMHLEKEQLILEFQMKDTIIGMIKSKPKALYVPFRDLAEVSYKVNWFISQFRLLVTSMQVLGEFPGAKEGIIKLSIKRKQKQAAKKLASHINLLLSEYRLKMMGEEDSFL